MTNPDAEKFYQHLDDCGTCCRHFPEPFALCDIGRELMFEAVEYLSAEWQDEAKRLRRQEELQREADANFEYYKNCEEP